MKRSVSHLRGDSGAVAVVVAVLLIVFIGFAALVVDMGYAYSVKRQLQAAADAAALAGCQELILGGTEIEIQAVAREYAEQHNAVRPGDGLEMLNENPDFEVTDTYVKVTVEKQMSLFFGRMFADDGGMIQAQAKARVAYLTGAKNLVPFALPLLRAERVTVNIEGEPERELTLVADADQEQTWKGTILAPQTPRASGYGVEVRAYNKHNEYIGTFAAKGVNDSGSGAALIVRDAGAALPGPSSMVLAVQLEDNIHTANATGSAQLGTTTLRLRLIGEPTEVIVKPTGQKKDDVSLSPVPGQDGWWSTSSLPVFDTTELYASRSVALEVKYGGSSYAFTDIARVITRRSTYPIDEITLGSNVVDAATPGSAVGVTVRLHDYVFNDDPDARPYDLKVSASANDVGNFGAVNFNTLNGVGQGGGAGDYKEYVAGGFPGVVSIGDYVLGEQGNMVGPTDGGLYGDGGGVKDPRIPSSDKVSFASWLSAGRPPSPRIVYVPLVEAMPNKGLPKWEIVGFAAFYVTPGAPSGWVYGHFIEYLLPSEGLQDVRPDGLYVPVPRLVADDIY